MLRHTYTSLIDSPVSRYGERISMMINVIDEDMDLKHMLYQLQLSMINARTIINQHLYNWMMPPSLKDVYFDENEPSVNECNIFIDVLKIYYDFINDNRHVLRTSKEDVFLILNSMIKVETFDDATNIVFTYDDKELKKKIKDSLIKKGYKIKMNNM